MTEASELSFSLNRKVSLLCICVLPILLLLGNWQLQRAEEKREIATMLVNRQDAEAVPLAELAQEQDLAFRRVALIGEFDAKRAFLLDNRQRNRRVGYEVLLPFHEQSGQWLLLNLGWLPAGASRAELPSLPDVPTGSVAVEAQIYIPSAEPILLAEQQLNSQFPQVILAVEMDKIADALNQDLFPHELRILADEPGALHTDWPGINMRPEQHIGYAVQWFAMALALCIWFIFANTNLWQIVRGK